MAEVMTPRRRTAAKSTANMPRPTAPVLGYTPEEAYRIICEDVRAIYNEK